MAITININGLTLVHKDSDGVAKADLPNVCLTPAPNGPVRRNYPNTAYSKDLAKGTVTVFADGGHMCANKGSEFSKSEGDEAGSDGGEISGTHLAEATWITYSPNVFIEGKNACRLTDKMLMNHGNTACLAGVQQKDLSEGKDKDCDSDDPPPLEEFDEGIGEYSKEELNDATKTTFGELSPYLHEKTDEEAEAIVSTMMNRKTQIYDSRAAFDMADRAAQAAQSKKNAAETALTALTKFPSPNKRIFHQEYTKAGHSDKEAAKMAESRFAEETAKAQESYNTAMKELGPAQNARTSAATAKDEAEPFLRLKNNEVKPNPTLSDIVAPKEEYEGTETGKGYYNDYDGWDKEKKQRNCKRWQTSKNAVEKLANDPSKRKDYSYMKSNNKGKRKLESWEVRIGGNDFSSKLMH